MSCFARPVALPRRRRQRVLLSQHPFVGDGLKGAGRRTFLSATLRTRINTIRQLSPSVIALFAR
jgi:hypothetical protein